MAACGAMCKGVVARHGNHFAQGKDEHTQQWEAECRYSSGACSSLINAENDGATLEIVYVPFFASNSS